MGGSVGFILRGGTRRMTQGCGFQESTRATSGAQGQGTGTRTGTGLWKDISRGGGGVMYMKFSLSGKHWSHEFCPEKRHFCPETVVLLWEASVPRTLLLCLWVGGSSRHPWSISKFVAISMKNFSLFKWHWFTLRPIYHKSTIWPFSFHNGLLRD